MRDLKRIGGLAPAGVAAALLLLASACGPAEEAPEPVDEMAPGQEDPGSIPETDPDPPDEPVDSEPL